MAPKPKLPTTTTKPTHNSLTIPLQKAVTDQNNIGWGGLYSGHISIDYQTAHNQEREHTIDQSANLVTLSDWTTPLFTLLWDQLEAQWTLRNEALHGSSDDEQLQFRHSRLQEKVTRLYSPKNHLLATDWGLLEKPVESILDLNTPSLEAWVLQVTPAIAQCQFDAEAILADFHDIAEYLEEPAPTEPESDPDNDPDDQNENFDPDNPLPQD